MINLYNDLNASEYEAIKNAEKTAGHKLIGRFGLKGQISLFNLMDLSDFDKELVNGIQLKAGEGIYRYITSTTAAVGISPLVKINFERRLVYFLTQAASDHGYVEFESRAEKAHWILLGDERRTAA